LIAIEKARAARSALTGEHRNSSRSRCARDGHRFESPQLHQGSRRKHARVPFSVHPSRLKRDPCIKVPPSDESRPRDTPRECHPSRDMARGGDRPITDDRGARASVQGRRATRSHCRVSTPELGNFQRSGWRPSEKLIVSRAITRRLRFAARVVSVIAPRRSREGALCS
jgi:hypothetical protein